MSFGHDSQVYSTIPEFLHCAVDETGDKCGCNGRELCYVRFHPVILSTTTHRWTPPLSLLIPLCAVFLVKAIAGRQQKHPKFLTVALNGFTRPKHDFNYPLISRNQARMRVVKFRITVGKLFYRNKEGRLSVRINSSMQYHSWNIISR